MTTIQHPLENLMDEQEYSRLVKRSLASVRRDRVLGRGCPYTKIGALVRYKPQTVREYIDRNVRGGIENKRGGR